jgi:uncharacterized protein YndB with AHSA1/START domain
MSMVHETITIRAGAAAVFDAYVNHIDKWWPRQGTYRYSFAPDGKEPRHIYFEPKLGGRFYEKFSDGSEYVIGQVIGWDPPNQLSYTWQDPGWPASTNVHVTFKEADGRTTVSVHHEGFGKKGIPEVADGYQKGLQEILAAFAKWIVK